MVWHVPQNNIQYRLKHKHNLNTFLKMMVIVKKKTKLFEKSIGNNISLRIHSSGSFRHGR